MTMDAALAALGVRDDTLSPNEKVFLDEHGYLPLEGIFADQVEALGARLVEIAEEEGERAGWELRAREGTGRVRFRKDPGAVRLGDLVNKDPVFAVCLRIPACLPPWRTSSGEISSSPRSTVALPCPATASNPCTWIGAYHVCNSLWLIDEFTEANGATRVVPGSHRTGRLPEDDGADPSASHPDEVLLLGRAGTVVIFNAHTWHGGTRNRTDQPRRAVHAYFCRRGGTPQTDQRRYARPETYARLNDAAKFILDIL